MTSVTIKKVGFSVIGTCLYLAALFIFVMRLAAMFTPNVFVRPSVAEALIFAAFTYLGCLCFRAAFRESSDRIMKAAFGIVFAAYLYLLFDLTMLAFDYGRFNTLFSAHSRGYTYALLKVNFIPFKTIGFYFHCISIGDMVRVAITNLFGNILAFMPFAIFLPLLFKKQKKAWVFILTTALISLLIELLQFAFQVGSSDIDDIILNCGGATLFYFVFHIKPLNKLINKITFLEY